MPTPVAVADFFSRAARLMREVLIDTARRHFGRKVPKPKTIPLDGGDSNSSGAGFEPGSDSLAPEAVDLFTEFHRAVEALEPKIRLVVDFHWYQELTHQETAAVLGIAVLTKAITKSESGCSDPRRLPVQRCRKER